MSASYNQFKPNFDTITNFKIYEKIKYIPWNVFYFC